MTLYPKGLLAFAGFAGVLLLAVKAGAGSIDGGLAVAGLIAIVAVEALVFFGAVWRTKP